MVWFQVCDTFWSHQKVMELPAAAGWLWIRAGSYCAQYLTNGHVTPELVSMLNGSEYEAKILVEAGLWTTEGNGFRFVEGEWPAQFCKIAGVAKHRPKIPNEIRTAVYQRDGWTCVKCGSRDDLTLDHIKPFSRGGEDVFENFQTMCRPCNSSKGDRI